MCWLNVYAVQYQYPSVHDEPLTLDRADHWERRLSAAQRRYLRALESLARVRRLLRFPTVQINVGAQQANVAGGAIIHE